MKDKLSLKAWKSSTEEKTGNMESREWRDNKTERRNWKLYQSRGIWQIEGDLKREGNGIAQKERECRTFIAD